MPDVLQYDRVEDRRLAERANWHGAYRGLRPHFHEEIQVSLVSRGLRRHVVGDAMLSLSQGQILIVPARLAHRAIPTVADEVRSTEYYFSPGDLPAAVAGGLARPEPVILDAPWLLDVAADELPTAIVGILTAISPAIGGAPRLAPDPRERNWLLEPALAGEGIGDIARSLGLSREGYIRAFSRRFGMTPHAYRINARLNDGRRLLRQGHAIADVAYEVGFCDQSHFGRLFLDCFGATPGRFRAAHLSD